MLEKLTTPAFILLVVCSIGILVSRDWRYVLMYFAALYLGVFGLVGVSWPFGLAGVKLVVGWMSGAILGTTQIGKKGLDEDKSWLAARIFRFFAAGLIILLVLSFSPKLTAWLPNTSLPVAQGSLILIGMGLLHLGMTSRPFRVTIGLLTVLAGFEILYASVESSLLVTGLLAGINLGLAMLGSYFLSMDTPEEPV
jgi:hypothetical protein